MTDTNKPSYEKAIDSMNIAKGSPRDLVRDYEMRAAQTYATLALVDEIRDLKGEIRETVAEEVSSALVDGSFKKADPAPLTQESHRYVVAKDTHEALSRYRNSFSKVVIEFRLEAAEYVEDQDIEGMSIYRVSVEVVQS